MGSRIPLLAVAALALLASSARAEVPRDVIRNLAQLRAAAGPGFEGSAHRALNAARRGRACAASAALSDLVERSKRVRRGAAAAARARRLQRRLLRGRTCGIRPPRLVVSAAADPLQDSLPKLVGARRPLARLEGANGRGSDFVADELLLSTTRRATLRAFLKRTGGELLRTVTQRRRRIHLVRVDPGKLDRRGLARDLRALEPLARGRHRVSSRAGLRLLALAADEAAAGVTASVNWVERGAAYLDRVTTEGPTGPGYAPGDPGFINYGPNPFTWWYMRRFTPGLSAAEAWRVLEIAARGGALNRVKVAIIDQGFTFTGDLHPDTPLPTSNAPGNVMCSGGSACPWHGTSVSAAAAALQDNGKGTAGSGGPVADLVRIYRDGTSFGTIAALFDAIDAGARVVNMSFGGEAPAIAGPAIYGAQEDATEAADALGVLVVTSAGNAGVDVDAEDCFAACWEEEWHGPCENNGVLCVGGVARPTDAKHPASNYGFEACGNKFCQVELFGPFEVFAPSSTNPTGGIARVGGTSVAAPYVAGVAALVWSANPSLTDDEVYGTLLNTAHGTNWAYVPRVVNAYGAVKAALGGQDLAPLVEIEAPSPGATFGYAGFNVVGLAAEAGDAEDVVCCTVKWSSNLDGPLGTGANLETVFGSPGLRLVEARVQDGTGQVDTDERFVNAVNTPPKVTIAKPLPGTTFNAGSSYKLQASTTDTETLGGLPCWVLTWVVRDLDERGHPIESSHGGCQPLVTFPSAGNRSITVTATDGAGASATAEVDIAVVTPPSNSPPDVWIEAPDDDAVFGTLATIALKGGAHDPDGGPVTLTWTVQVGAAPQVTIGTGPTVAFKPWADHGIKCKSMTLRLFADDDDGRRSAQVTITSFDGNCIG